MRLLNKLGEELIQRKKTLMNSRDSLVIEDNTFVINEKYHRNGIISDEIKNSIFNNEVSIPEFEKTLLKYNNFRKQENEIKEEIIKFADKLENELSLQEIPLTKKDMKIGNDLTTINVVKTICLPQEMMMNYIGIDKAMYEKISSKCVIPFFILRLKKIIEDVKQSEMLRSNYINLSSSKPYTQSSNGNNNLLIDIVLEINIETLEERNNYNETALFIGSAINYFEDYYEARIVE